MGKGRVSAAERAIAPLAGAVTEFQRPDAPYDLTDEQSVEWWAIVNRMPADWFPRETHALLADYCRHVVSARRIAQLIAAAEAKEAFDLNEYDQLGKMAERESRVIASLATKMRLTQQTTYDKSKKKPVLTEKPWD